MKIIVLSFIFSLTVIMAPAQVDRTFPPQPNHPQKLNVGVLIPIPMKNGMQVYLAPVKKYPKFTISVNIEQPNFQDEVRNEQRRILSDAYLQKKSNKYPNGEIDSIVNFKAAMLSVTNTGGTIKGMKRDVETLLEMYSDLLFNPIIADEIISEIANEYHNEQAHKSEKTKSSFKNKFSAQDIVDSLVFGVTKQKEQPEKVHNYNDISPEDVWLFHKDRIVANNAVVVIIGDFNEKECRKLMDKYFGHWHNGKKIINEDSKELKKSQLVSRKIIVVNNPNAVQSNIRFSWNLEDAFTFFDNSYELEVLNKIFGESQMSFLYRNLREDKGLCYFIRSNIGTNSGGGVGGLSTTVRNDQTAYAIENIILEMLRIRNYEVTDEDLRIAKNSLIGEHTRSLSGVAPIPYISFAMMKEKYNLPNDYLQNKVSNYYNVTKQDVLNMAQKYIKPFECLIVVTGKTADLIGTLEKFGEVSYFTEDGKEYIVGE